MVRILDSAMDVALEQELTYLCRIWELTCDNGEVHRFTDSTSDILFGGEVWKYDPGIRVSSVVLSSGGQPDNAAIEVIAAADFMPMARIRQGGLTNATFRLIIVDHRDPDAYGPLELFAGMVSSQKFNNKNRVELGINSDNGAGKKTIGELYSRQCRAKLGDERCKVDIDALSVGFEIVTVTDQGYGFTAAELTGSANDFFKFGKIKWNLGLNDTLTDEVKANVTGTGKVVLSLYPRNPMSPGDTGIIYPGCDFQVSTCGIKFANLNNFRGEPYVPPANILVFSGSLGNLHQRVLYYADANLGYTPQSL